MKSSRCRATIVRASAVVAVAFALTVPVSADAAGPSARVPHIGVGLPAAYDPVASYEAQATCDPKPKPGALRLAALLRRTYGAGQSVSISRACSIGGTSEHKEGRAVDWMTSVRNARGKANAEAFLTWLVGPDSAGVPFGNAIRMGVMYVGWNNRYWASYAPERGWAELKGCLSKPGGANDTVCHRNHVHLSLSWDGASGRTSMWDGTALTPYCASAWTTAGPASPGRTSEPIAVTPVVVLSTREGVGLVAAATDPWSEDWPGHGDGQGGHDWQRDLREDPIDPAASPTPTPVVEPTPGAEPTPASTEIPEPTPTPEPTAAPTAQTLTGPACRVHPMGWGPGGGAILASVVGQGEIPATGVAAVVVQVSALGATAPAEVRAAMPGTDTVTAVQTVRMNGRATGTAIVPVASDGTIALSVSAGAADLRVTVTGYFPAGDQPNETVVRTRR